MKVNYDKNGRMRIVVNGRSYRVHKDGKQFYYHLNEKRISCSREVKMGGTLDTMPVELLSNVLGRTSTHTKEMFALTSKRNNDMTRKRIAELERMIKLNDTDFTDAIKNMESFERKELSDFIDERTVFPFGQDERGIQEYEDMRRKQRALYANLKK
jgi:hypothetical protein